MLQTLETAEQCEWEEQGNPSLCILEIPLAEERDKSSRPPGRAGCSGGGSLPPRMEGGQAVAQECAPGISALPVEAIPPLLARGDCMPHPMTHWSLRTPSRHVSKAAAVTRPPSGVPPSSPLTPGADGNHLRSAPPGLQLGGWAAVCSWAAGEGQTLGASALQRGCRVLSKQQ